jgi:hypothetical protein
MANVHGITITFVFPNPDYAEALAQLLKRLDWETVTRHAAKNVWYNSRAEADVMWSVLRALEFQLNEAGYAPR